MNGDILGDQRPNQRLLDAGVLGDDGARGSLGHTDFATKRCAEGTHLNRDPVGPGSSDGALRDGDVRGVDTSDRTLMNFDRVGLDPCPVFIDSRLNDVRHGRESRG